MEKENCEEMMELLINHRGEDFRIVVNMEMANTLLNDPISAEKYIEEVLNGREAHSVGAVQGTDDFTSPNREITESEAEVNSVNENPTVPIWTQKRPTPKDFEATEVFLTLRQKYSKRFDDKKTMKSQLWKKIAEEMDEMGFNVGGTGKEIVEKLRLKFSNLQKQYFLYIKHQKTTGESQKDPPSHLELLHSILEHKDKTNPSNLIDSLGETSAASSVNSINSTPEIEELVLETSSSANTSNAKAEVRNRFSTIETPRSKMTINSQLLELTKKDIEQRNEHFTTLKSLMEIQNQQRDRFLNQLDKLIEIQSSRKRKREDSESD